MAATLINPFIVPQDRDAEYFKTWKSTTEHFSAQPGFIETHLHKNTGVGDQTFQYINIARWDSGQAWKDAHDAYMPPEARIPGVKGHPSIFECIVDQVSTTGVTAAADVAPATLINVFMVPAQREIEFLEHWRRTITHFSANSGFVETHLHRNTGHGNNTFQFINIALWTSGDAWRGTHDKYVPTEYSIPGVKGHPAIYRCVFDAYSQEHSSSRTQLPYIQQAS